MKRGFVIVFLVFFTIISGNLFGQEIVVTANNRPLNKILTQLINNYDANISFNDKGLSEYNITINSSFDDIEEAVSYLLDDLPLQYEIKHDVIIIYQKKKQRKKNKWILSGRVIERGSEEPLPYSHLKINSKGTTTDLMGNFSFTSETDSIFNLKVSHLGYYILDTIIDGTSEIVFELSPSSIGLSEVVIKNSLVEKSGQYGLQPGLIKLNNRIAGFLPGYGDNSVFNLLRLQPGILASGEQTNELIIWGSYEGHSKVVFDGFTIYGLKNFNDNISSFNPLLAKDIEVYKGGFDVSMGERVGGIVNITGKLGNIRKTSFVITANNMTLNGMVEIPIAKRGSLILAFRHTYYELYDPEDLGVLIRRNNDNDTTNDVDVNVQPDYKFRDLNIKYSTRLGKNDDLFYVSFYGGIDKFSYNIDETFKHFQFLKSTKEENTQSGASVFYGKKWGATSRSNFSFSYSSIRTKYYDNLKLFFPQVSDTNQLEDKHTDNLLHEASLKVDNTFDVGSWHKLELGAEIITNRVELVEDTFNINYLRMKKELPRLNLYAMDKVNLGKTISMKGGLRLTHAVNLQKVYLDPRLSLSIAPSESLRFNLAWGIYHQFITKSSVLDNNGNYRYLWTVSDNEDVPVLSAYHYVFGGSFSSSGFTFNIDAYYKQTEGLTRFIRSVKYNIEDVFTGKSKSYGVDFLVKHDFRSHSFWISYSLSKTEELFEYFLDGKYRRSPQDQRHEVKLAGLLNFDPFFFSADYVYGSGFPDYIYNQQPNNTSSHIYSRLDISFIYKFLNRKLNGEAGLSILNVLNHQNFKLANFERIPANQSSSINIYAEAIPFTPTLFLKFYL